MSESRIASTVRFGIRIGLILVALSAAPTASDETALATVGDRVITRSAFEAEMARRGGPDSHHYTTPGQRRALLDEIIRREALVAGGTAAGYGEHPEVLAAVERIVAERFRSDRLEALLSEVTVSPEEVEEFYEAHRAEWVRPERRQLAIVEVRAPEAAPAEVRQARRALAEQALAEAQALPASLPHLGEVARRHSDDRASRYKGGVVGWVSTDAESPHRLPAEVIDALRALPAPGALAPLIDGGDAFYVVRLVAIDPAEARPLARVADGLRHRLLTERRQEIRDRFERELLDDLGVRVDESLFDAIGPRDGGTAETRDETTRRPPAMPAG